jgi:prepilin-type N-terminal cleavage/methylation domain-containing protein
MHPNPCARHGFTMVELLISLTLIAVMMGGLMIVSGSITSTVRAGTASAALEVEGEMAIKKVVEVMREATSDTVTPRPVSPFSASLVTFQRADSWSVKGFSWLPVERLRMELRPGEFDNGADDDGNGLVDERRVTWITDPGAPGQRTVTICHWVSELLEGELPNGADDNGNGLRDEAGLCFAFEDDAAIVRLTLQRRDPDGRLLTRTFERRVGFRN